MGYSSLAVAVLASTGALLAHGGQYRGHWSAPPIPSSPPGSGPATGGPLPPGGGPSGPTTGGRPAIGDGTSWQVWWEFHRDSLLEPPVAPLTVAVSGSDEFYLGAQRRVAAASRTRPTDKDRADLIVPALLDALQRSGNRDIQTACMVALAKVGIDPPGTDLRTVFGARLQDGDQEVRETAALAFGIAGGANGFDALAALLQGTDTSDRTRTFAAWSLGLLARRATDAAQKRRVRDLLSASLLRKDDDYRDLRVGLVQGIGLLAPDPQRSAAEKRLVWDAVADLWRFYELDLGKGSQLVQAHAPIAIARLLGRGTTTEHQRAKARLIAELSPRGGRHSTIVQSAAMALGTLSLPPEDGDDGDVSAALLRCYREGNDQLARFFAALALGRIGGAQNRKALLGLYDESTKAIERPWIALALGLVGRAHLQRTGGELDREIADLLLQDLEAIDNDDAQSSLALALGLCGHRDAAGPILRLLDARGSSDMLTGYLAVSLALLDHRGACDQLADLMQRSLRRPFVLLQCAVALGRLGDERAATLLLEMLDKNDSAAALGSIAMALGAIKDRRSIEPLIAALRDESRPKLARAFAAAGLGGIGDKDPLPWNTPIAVDCNYMATVDTLTNGQSGVLDIL